MPRVLKSLVRWLLAFTSFELRRRLPEITLDPLQLLLAIHYAIGDSITLLQVGACDGVSNDPVHDCVKQTSTRAILVEPNPIAFERLKQTYKGFPNVTLVQAAVGERDGEAYFYRARCSGSPDGNSDRRIQYASFSRTHLEHHGVKADEIERITVPSRTLASLVTELGLHKVDLLQVDAEGFDAEIVRMALAMSALPDCINFEHIHLTKAERKSLFDSLKASGYVFGYDGWNVLAVQQSWLNRMLQNGPSRLR